MTDEPTSSNADARENSSGPGRPNEDRSPTRATPAEMPVVTSSDKSPTIAIDHAALANGREPDLAAYFEHSYRSPASAKVASRTLIDAFDDKGLWLASLIQPTHLARELAQNCSDVTRLVILQWVRQGETHKLKLLGETLLSVADSQISQETTRMMMVLAGLLGILRPSTAQKLAARAVPRMPDTADVELVSDASRWVEAGVILESSSTEERVFWNRRLREPDAGWDWDTTEARLALSHLAKVLPREGDLHELFQNAIPGCWWDLWRDQVLHPRHLPAMPMLMAPGGSDTRTQPNSGETGGGRRGSFKGGLAAGIAASVVLGGVGLIVLADAEEDRRPRLSSTATASHDRSVKADSQPLENRKTDSKNAAAAAPPIRDSLRYLKAVLAGGTASAQSAGKAAAGGSTAKKSPATLPAPPNLSKKDLREHERVIFEHDHPEIQKLFSLLKDGSLRQHESLLQGESGAAPAGSTEHQQLLHWLLLDPPEQADTRLTATKLAMRDLPVEEAVSLFDLCFYPGSPNEIEIRQCAGLLLEVSEELTSEQRAKLKAISESKT